MKRNLALGLGNVLLVSVMTAPMQAAPAVPVLEEMAPSVQNQTPAISGRYENLYWSIVDDVLTVSGSGPMREISREKHYPWQDADPAVYNIKKIVVGEGITSIAPRAFKNMDKWDLTEGIEFPGSLRSIGEEAFNWCQKLGPITLPANLESIGNSAFWGCDDMTEVVFTATSAPTVGYGAFASGLKARTYYIPENWIINEDLELSSDHQVKKLYSIQLQADSSQGSATVSQSDLIKGGTEITASAQAVSGFEFKGWTVEAPAGFELPDPGQPNIQFSMPEGSVILKANFEKIPPSASGTHGSNLSWSIKDGILTISGEGEMETVKYIDDYPWYKPSFEDEPVTKIVIEEGVTSVADNAFCFGKFGYVTEIELPQSLKRIGKEAFYGAGTRAESKTLIIPPDLELIDDYAFLYVEPEEIIFSGLQAPKIGRDALGWINRLKTVYIPGEGAGYEDVFQYLKSGKDVVIKKMYSIHAQAEPGGTVLAPAGLLKPEEKVMLQAHPAEGYEFKG